MSPSTPETVFTRGAPALESGPGAADEAGFDLARWGVGRALVVTDPAVAATGAPRRAAERMAESGAEARAFAVPTTTGTGAESTTVCVLDVLDLKVKTGISHVRLRPTLAVVDPALTATRPPEVTAAGMDVLCHAYDREHTGQRVPYCGANPISDVWSERALEPLARSFRAAVRDGDDLADVFRRSPELW
ncbi:iron-containing alcohol dehydrogenase [Saccharothrix sp. SC076]|nr:iron-containing alcohol dehydrogenase [Saccharothrix obliqua]